MCFVCATCANLINHSIKTSAFTRIELRISSTTDFPSPSVKIEFFSLDILTKTVRRLMHSYNLADDGHGRSLPLFFNDLIWIFRCRQHTRKQPPLLIGDDAN